MIVEWARPLDKINLPELAIIIPHTVIQGTDSLLITIAKKVDCTRDLQEFVTRCIHPSGKIYG